MTTIVATMFYNKKRLNNDMILQNKHKSTIANIKELDTTTIAETKNIVVVKVNSKRNKKAAFKEFTRLRKLRSIRIPVVKDTFIQGIEESILITPKSFDTIQDKAYVKNNTDTAANLIPTSKKDKNFLTKKELRHIEKVKSKAIERRKAEEFLKGNKPYVVPFGGGI